MKKKLLAFYGKQSIKDKYLKRVQKHYDADEIIHGTYWENGKGCAVGCTIQGSDHKKFETLLGIPESLAHLEDKIFEGLTNGEAKEFPLKFLNAIAPGADLSQVSIKMKIYILTDKHNGVIQYANEETKKIIEEIVRLQKKLLKGENVDDELAAARSAAWSAAWSAESAAESAARSAWSAARSAESAESAAWSARSAAESARSAESAARSAESAESAARSAAYKGYAKKLIQLLKEAK
jgi:hypothetical protein